MIKNEVAKKRDMKAVTNVTARIYDEVFEEDPANNLPEDTEP